MKNWQTVARVCDLPDEGVQCEIGGCNPPTPAAPLDWLTSRSEKHTN